MGTTLAEKLWDSHLVRKHGLETASGVRDEARCIKSMLVAEGEETRLSLLMEFDRSLKARGLNPGTSADLTVACLFVHLLGDQLA